MTRVAWLVAVLLACLAGDALAAKRIDPRAPTFTTTWTGGDLSIPFNWCVASTDGNNTNSGSVINYTARVAAPYTIASGANTIAVSMAYVDLSSGLSYNLTPGTYLAGFPLTGQFRNCPTRNPNGRLVLTIPQANFNGKPPGTYTATFTIDVENSKGGGGPDTTTFTVTVTIPDSIAITNINDIHLPAWDGVNDVVGSDAMCVYRAGGATYGVRLTGTAGGAFRVANGSNVIPLQVTWTNGIGTVTTAVSGTLYTGKTGTSTTSTTCNNGATNNATLGVRVLATDMANASVSGTYTGTITVNVVAP